MFFDAAQTADVLPVTVTGSYAKLGHHRTTPANASPSTGDARAGHDKMLGMTRYRA